MKVTRRAFLGTAASVPLLANVEVSTFTTYPPNQDALLSRICVIGTVLTTRSEVVKNSARREMESLLDAKLANLRANVLDMLDREAEAKARLEAERAEKRG